MGERRKLDKAFKEQAVLRTLFGETTANKMAEELNVHYSTIRDWLRYYEKHYDFISDPFIVFHA